MAIVSLVFFPPQNTLTKQKAIPNEKKKKERKKGKKTPREKRTELVRPSSFLDLRQASTPPLLLLQLAPQKLQPGLTLIDPQLGLSNTSVRLGVPLGDLPVGGGHGDGALEDLLLDNDEPLGVMDGAV